MPTQQSDDLLSHPADSARQEIFFSTDKESSQGNSEPQLKKADTGPLREQTQVDKPVASPSQSSSTSPSNEGIPPPKILYHLITKDREGTILKNIESPEPISTGDSGITRTLTTSIVLEILTTSQLGTFYSNGKNVIKILSLPLINVLREVYAKLCNEHIGVLLNYLNNTFGDNLRLERERYRKHPPMATFDNIWMLFKLGQDVYIKGKNTDAPIPMRIAEVHEEVSYTLQTKDREGYAKQYSTLTSYEIKGWGVGCTGAEMSPQIRDSTIFEFEGEKEIFSLNVYPKEFHDNANYEQKLRERGKRYWDFCVPSYRHYEGYTIADRGEPRRQLNGRVVIDFESYVKHKYEKDSGYESDSSDDGYIAEFGFRGVNTTWREFPSPRWCECEFCITSIVRKTRKAPVFHSIDASDAKAFNDPEIYFLSDYILRGYALKEQKWLSFHIYRIKGLRREEAPFDNLILPEGIKNTIKSIFWSYKQSSDEVQAWSADFIQEKGEGQIFLLHGTPGVGKTCTAEIVADYMKRPLLPLTCGDMGITASDVQKNINKYFELGEHWGAVILMDEADIYLEQRAADQLERNSLVSVFLRALEYFRGILFITTNRVGTFDDAFISRIHVALYYPPLVDHDRVLIWENNFRRLERDAAIKVADSTRIYTRIDPELNQIKWNGREIRNAIQTAVALARKAAYDKNMKLVILEARHIEAVVNTSRAFKAYLNEVHDNLDEAGRARRQEARADNFDLDQRE